MKNAGFALIAWALTAQLLAPLAFSSDDPGLSSIRESALKGHISFLASDEMAGRDSLSPEGRIAAEYIAGFFRRAELVPVGDDGTFFQNFSMVEAQVDRANVRLRATIASGAGTFEWDYALGSDFSLPRQGGVDFAAKAPLVFAGYGISAPEYDYDDFAGIDIAGKVVLVLTHEPQEGDTESRFLGKFHTVHAYNWWKPEVIRQRGAVGIVMVDERAPHRPRRIPSGPTNGQVRRDRPGHALTSPFWDLPLFAVSRRVADELLSPTGKTIDELQSAIDGAGRPASMPVDGVTVDMKRPMSSVRIVQTRNVVGVLKGSDPSLAAEHILVTGHYDHVGREGEFIFRGADDNASATAAVIAIAEAFRANPTPPRRSLMFLVFEAEEDGLLGAFHYVAHPVVPLQSTVAVLNMDMIGRDEESPTWNTKAADNRNSVNIVGTLYSPDIRRVIEAANRDIGLTLDYKTDGDDREGWFSRSDHYPFAVHGVPIGFFNTGEHPDYHTANDTWDRINYSKMEKIVRLVYASAKSLANQDGRPGFVTQRPQRSISGSN